MVAQTIELPNIRKFFVPDPGCVIAECDLSGADAQVVAWDAGDEDLKDAFRKGLKLHIKNARDVFPEKTKGLSDEALKATDRPGGIYHDCKRAVHLTDYGGSAKTMALTLGWLIVEAEHFQRQWFGLHPAIKLRMEAIERELAETRTVYNAFGARRVYFDYMEGLLPQALAWIPQSTVAMVCDKGALNVYHNISWIDILLQVHDSIVVQWPLSKDRERKLVRDELRITVPYPDPLIIPWKLSTSRKSWGDTVGVEW